jgi:hypothetical protein
VSIDPANTLVIAVYAALVSTITLAWNMFSWIKSNRPALHVTIKPHSYLLYNDGSSRPVVTVVVTNRGPATTHVSHTVFVGYRSYFAKLIGKIDKTALALEPIQRNNDQKFPVKLDRSQSYEFYLNAAEFKILSSQLVLYLRTSHSMSDKDVFTRAKLH